MDKSLVDTWIKEIAPHFPELDLKILSFPGNKINRGRENIYKKSEIEYYHDFYLTYNHEKLLKHVDEETRNILKEKSIEESVFCFRLSYYSLIDLFIDYCIKEKLNYFSNLELYNNIDLFFENCTKKINNWIEQQAINIDIASRYLRCNYQKIPLSAFLEESNLSSNWLKDIFKNICNSYSHYNKISDIIYSSIKQNDPVYVIQALYSCKGYSIQAYIAHHLIRALFSEETIPFIKQYYRIKEKIPNEYFWNIIFLCQFGFRMYYYFWLTDDRLFMKITKEKFDKVAKEYRGHSSQQFFSHFKKNVSISIKRHLQRLYREENFKMFLDNLSLDLSVSPIEKFKNKSTKFRFKPVYKVEIETPNEYIIMGDDYYLKAYKKSNFNIVTT
jgi:hypothetical protein